MQNLDEPFHLEAYSNESGETARVSGIGVGPKKNLIVGRYRNSVIN